MDVRVDGETVMVVVAAEVAALAGLAGLAVHHHLAHAAVAFDQDGIVAVAARLGVDRATAAGLAATTTGLVGTDARTTVLRALILVARLGLRRRRHDGREGQTESQGQGRRGDQERGGFAKHGNRSSPDHLNGR